MLDALLLALGVACSTVGFAWLALAMHVHWHQVAGQRELTRRAATMMRVQGTLALMLSLLLCLAADHASMASLVWIMSLAAAALAVAFTLTWRPHTLEPLTWLVLGQSRSSVSPGGGVH